ncbi:MAG: DnaJ domain-containing protein [Deltaproteobacteria bacterium]|jgi:curved DNA-binding protein CbpA|nr:DnaJ domain-containing protein [Deltaproteobacteria bacterium]MBW2520298.1 DnaJ domain-containing protein [Deltaproteobacteria bacterium]
MSDDVFFDYYELLQLSPNADTETIERVSRHLAKKYHPDNKISADKDLFLKIVEAYRTLSSPETRTSYDLKHRDYWNQKWSVAAMATDSSTLGEDKDIREHLLSMLYVQRRSNMKNPGLGEIEMARLLDTPSELIEFHLWYLKSKGWVERLDTGHLAITALGVDEAEKRRHLLNPSRLIGLDGSAKNEGKKNA